MIDLSVSRSAGAAKAFRVFGIGGAGANVLDRMVLEGVSASHLVAVNADTAALQACVAGQKLAIGESATRGMGTGGDPELGRAAVEESFYALRSAVRDLDAVFLLGGLGGGTASAAVPVVAEMARQEGALVIAFVTLPFAFEGRRRQEQALEALARLQAHADAVICFENDLMGGQVSPRAGIAQAFAAADQIISQSVRAVAALFSRKGLINLGFDDLKAALAGNRARTLFAHGEAEGNNRPYDALARALKSPLMDRGRLLRECDTILVQVTGGPELTLTEVELLMEELNRKVEQRSRLLFGVAVDARSEGRLSVTLFATLAGEAEAAGETHRDDTEADTEAPRASEPVFEESAVVAPITAAPVPAPPQEVEPPRRGDGLDEIFEPSPEPMVSASEENHEAFDAIIEEEAEGLEPLVPIADTLESTLDEAPAALPSFVIEEEPEEPEDEEQPEVSEEAWEAPEAEQQPAAFALADDEEPVPADTEESVPPVKEEAQPTLFTRESESIFSRQPTTRVARPIPGRMPGGTSPFFDEVPRPISPVEELPVAAVEPVVPEESNERDSDEPEAHLEAAPEVYAEEPEEDDTGSGEPSAVFDLPVAREAFPSSEEPVSPDEEAEPVVKEPEEHEGPNVPEPPVVASPVAKRDESLSENPTPARTATPPPLDRKEERSAPGKAPLQETLKFDAVKRGRFEKSEPTIEDGQDLDVPTFLRRNIKIRPQ